MMSHDLPIQPFAEKGSAKEAIRQKELGTDHTDIAVLTTPKNERNALGSEIIIYASPVVTLAVIATNGMCGITLADVVRRTGVHAHMVRYYCRLGLLAPFNGDVIGELIFDRNAVEDVLRIEHYRYVLGVKRRALRLICELRREAMRQDFDLVFLQTSWGRVG